MSLLRPLSWGNRNSCWSVCGLGCGSGYGSGSRIMSTVWVVGESPGEKKEAGESGSATTRRWCCFFSRKSDKGAIPSSLARAQ